MSRDVVKQELLAKLKQEHCFWSYNENSIKDIPDDMLIENARPGGVKGRFIGQGSQIGLSLASRRHGPHSYVKSRVY